MCRNEEESWIIEGSERLSLHLDLIKKKHKSVNEKYGFFSFIDFSIFIINLHTIFKTDR